MVATAWQVGRTLLVRMANRQSRVEEGEEERLLQSLATLILSLITTLSPDTTRMHQQLE